jgi:uncharacterized protein YjbI with pentapeptide repeats
MERIVSDLPFIEEVPLGRDLRGIGLGSVAHEFDFTGWDFSYGQVCLFFSGCILNNAKLDRVDYTQGYLKEAKMTGASFRGANLSRVNASNIVAHDCCFDGATLRRTNFQDSDLTGSSFVKAKCQNATFGRGVLLGCNFQGAKLDGAVITQAKIDKTTDFRGASLINIWYHEERNQGGSLAWPENDWRQATYDETTVYGDRPEVEEYALLNSLISLMSDDDSLDAKVIATKLRAARPLVPKDPENWIESVFQQITPEQAKLLESAIFDAVKMVD